MVDFNSDWKNPKSTASGTQGRPNSIDPNRGVLGPYGDQVMAPPPAPPAWDQTAHDQLMRSAYNPSRYNYSSLPKLPTPQEQADAFLAFLRAAGERGGMDSGSGAGAAAAAAAIRQSYDQMRQQLTANRDQASGVLSQAMGDYNRNIGSNYDMYKSGAKSISDSIAARGTDAQRTNQSQTDQFLKSMSALGVGGDVVRAQGVANADSLRNQNQMQADLAARLAQVAASDYQNYQNSGALVNQGATGRLANNYNDMMAMLGREETAALSGGSSGGGGGGSGSRGGSGKLTASERKMLAEQDMIDGVIGSDVFDSETALSALAVKNPDYFNYLIGRDAETEGFDIGELAYRALRPFASQDAMNRIQVQGMYDDIASGRTRR